MTKILDIKRSITAANGNVSLAKELFTMLLTDIDERLKQIEASFKSNNMQELEEHIHKLYGATAYCIVPPLRQSAKSLEKILREKDYSQLITHIDVVVNEIIHLIKEGPAFIELDWSELKT